MIETLNYGTRRARKEHRCWHCYRPIEKGSEYEFGTFKYDDVYTLKYHKDCNKAALWYMRDIDYMDDGGGYPPLFDVVMEDTPQLHIDYIRGYFPHVACRLEYREAGQ